MTSLHQSASSILVVEDDFAIREALTEFLEEEGYLIVGAANGLEALAYLRTAPQPALILLDLRMPVMNGQQFLAAQSHVRALASTPVVLLSADRSTDQRVVAPNVVGYLDKPVRLAELLQVVEQYCNPAATKSAGWQ